MKDKSSGSNREKIKIEVFGGDYASSFLGTVTYSVATRFGYVINKDVQGGIVGRHSLKIYENGDNFDLVIESSGWAAFIVRAWILDENPVAHEVKCTLYNPAGKNEVTSLFTNTVFMASDNNGNIGIGTHTPQAKLDVRGKIIADEVQIKVNKGADFVFHPDYTLRPLSEVKSFVEENRHLPEIPSEKQMQTDGVNVNDMQIKLLQKIEELTLYVIEQDKKNLELEKRVKELENK